MRTGGGSSHRAARCHHERKIAVHLRSHGLRKGLLWAPNSVPSLGAIRAKTMVSSLVRLSQDLSCSWRPCPCHLMRVRVWRQDTLQGGLAKVSLRMTLARLSVWWPWAKLRKKCWTLGQRQATELGAERMSDRAQPSEDP